MINFLSHILCALDIHSWIEQPYSKNRNIKADYCVNCEKEVEGVNYQPPRPPDRKPDPPEGPPNTLEKEWEVK